MRIFLLFVLTIGSIGAVATNADACCKRKKASCPTVSYSPCASNVYPSSYNSGACCPNTYPGAYYPGTSYPGAYYPGASYPGASYPGASYPSSPYLMPGAAQPGTTVPGGGVIVPGKMPTKP